MPGVWAIQAAQPFVLDGAASAWRGLVALGIVLGLIALLAWLIRRGHLPIGGRPGRGGVTIESALPLGERRSLVIVSVEGRRLMLGLTPSQVSLVTELGPAAPGFDAALERAGARPEEPQS